MDLNLSDRQKSAIAAALTIIAAVVILCAIGGLVYLIVLFFRTFSQVFLPLAVGGIAALVFNPYYNWLRERLKLPAALAVAAVFLSILIPLAGFFWFFGALAQDQISELVTRVPDWWERAVEWTKDRWPTVVRFLEEHPVGQKMRTAIEEQQETLLKGFRVFGEGAISTGRVVFRGIGTALAWAVLPVYFAFFLRADSRGVDHLEQMLPFLKGETRKDVVYLIDEFVNMIVAFFRGQLIVAFLQGLLFAIGFHLVGLKYGFILGLVLGFLNIIPYLGSIVGLSIAIPLALAQPGGGLLLLAWVLAVFTAVQMIEGYLLTPKIMGDRTGLHPIAIIVAIFFWGSAFGGILGMIMAIPLTAFLVVFWRLAKEKYIQELV